MSEQLITAGAASCSTCANISVPVPGTVFAESDRLLWNEVRRVVKGAQLSSMRAAVMKAALDEKVPGGPRQVLATASTFLSDLGSLPPLVDAHTQRKAASMLRIMVDALATSRQAKP